MNNKTYSIFGAGAAGLYTAWRLLNGKLKNEKFKHKQLAKGDVLELYDWGKYDFSKEYSSGSRVPGARVCTWHYKNNNENSYLELGGMRYSAWNGDDGPKAQGHRVVTQVIAELGLEPTSVPFNESNNPLFFLRASNMYLNDITSSNPAPYNVDHYGATDSPDTGFNAIENLAGTEASLPQTRTQWCEFYKTGKIEVEMPESSVFKKGEHFKDIGYWDLMFDQLGSEGFNYTADGNGYTSNIINWNAAVAIQANNEFTPGTEYKTLTHGYSSIFTKLFEAIVKLAKQKGVIFEYRFNTRLHSILIKDAKIVYTIATRANPTKPTGERITDAAWLAMPRHSIELVAQATRYQKHNGPKDLDVLNGRKMQLYLESSIMQPSYKVGMFFSDPWWTSQTKLPNPAPYQPQLSSYELTAKVMLELLKKGFPKRYLDDINALTGDASIIEVPYTPASVFIKTVEQVIGERLTIKQEELLLATAENDTIGPSVTDLPIRQVVYFGNNALKGDPNNPVYGLLASYDDEQYTDFWRELELGPNRNRTIPASDDLQPLEGPRKLDKNSPMVKMLRKQLAAVHFGPASDYTMVPAPLETRYMDWSLPPFNAGYHAWAAHYDIGDVQRKIRYPVSLAEKSKVTADIFIVGEAYSNDQAWVEGAFCTAESVLNDFFGIDPIINNKYYPFICPE